MGQHELLSAISYAQKVLNLNINFELEFLPFRLISTTCLNDGMPKISKEEFFRKKLGDENFENMKAGVAQWSEEKGIVISFEGPMSQSTRGHRLSRKAYLLGGQKLQLPVLCALYNAHLQQGKDIADFEVLADIAEKAGMMTRTEALAFLKSSELEDEVNKIIEEAKGKGIHGVPLILIDNKWAISGGQSSDVLVKIFQKMADSTTLAPNASLESALVAQVY